jgi:hypothetical protein
MSNETNNKTTMNQTSPASHAVNGNWHGTWEEYMEMERRLIEYCDNQGRTTTYYDKNGHKTHSYNASTKKTVYFQRC